MDNQERLIRIGIAVKANCKYCGREFLKKAIQKRTHRRYLGNIRRYDSLTCSKPCSQKMCRLTSGISPIKRKKLYDMVTRMAYIEGYNLNKISLLTKKDNVYKGELIN